MNCWIDLLFRFHLPCFFLCQHVFVWGDCGNWREWVQNSSFEAVALLSHDQALHSQFSHSTSHFNSVALPVVIDLWISISFFAGATSLSIIARAEVYALMSTFCICMSEMRMVDVFRNCRGELTELARVRNWAKARRLLRSLQCARVGRYLAGVRICISDRKKKKAISRRALRTKLLISTILTRSWEVFMLKLWITKA